MNLTSVPDCNADTGVRSEHKTISRLVKSGLPGALLLVVFAIPSLLAAAPTAKEVVERMDKNLYGTTSRGKMEITIQRPRFSRTLVLETYEDRNKDRSFIRILSPKKDRGVAFLKWGSNLWQYIPRIGKEIKIEGSLMQDSWMGSDFTNDDLVRVSSIVDDYSHSLLESKDDSLFKLQLIPRPDAPIVWSRVVADVRKDLYLPVRQEFYDHKNRLVRLMTYSEFKLSQGRHIPMRIKVATVRNGKVRSATELRFVDIRFDEPIADSVFSRSNLRR